ncbi:UNVERIFIED_CONTAM: hypothetical protein RMT77_012886 [Armadillidium vulgare]
MAEPVNENVSYTQDLFSPLQFCEVVEEGHQQNQSSLQHSHQHSPLTQQTLTGMQVTQNLHHHSSTSGQIQGQNQVHPTQQQVQPQHQQSIKQETKQSIQPPVLNSNEGTKSQPLIASVSSMEIFLTSNPVQLQSVGAPLVAIHQQTLSQPMYQVQLTRHQHQTLHVNSIPLPSHPSDVHVSHHPETSQRQLPLPSSAPLSVETVVSVNSSESYEHLLNTNSKTPTMNAVATQTTSADHSGKEDDEPEIIFTTVPGTESQPLCNGKKPDSSKSKLQISTVSSSLPVGNNETKSVPVKRTWRRPWKKKKEREKTQRVKKTRRLKRRKIVMPKKNVVHVDPRHGPPIDTSNTIVARESEETINQLKQKRQRIKLNRNSGREYINRLGKVVRARKIGSPCNCPLKCWDRMGSKIIDIFNNFWDLCDFNLQNSYLFTCLKLCDVKRRYTKKQPAEESRRQNTFEYFVRISGKHLRVCKKAFMSSHGLTSDKRLRTLFAQMKEGALIPEPDRRGKHLRPSKSQQSNGHHFTSHNNTHNSSNNSSTHHNNHHNSNNNNTYNNLNQNKINSKQKNGRYKRKSQASHRIDSNKQTMYTPPTHPVSHLHPHCTPPPPPAHGTSMQEPPHTYIPNGDIYFPGHYLEPPQAMAPPHMNQIPSCQKMLETPAYFMAGMKENTFHQ